MSCNCQEVAEKGKKAVEESFAMELLKGYKKQFYVTVAVLITIILLLTGYIIYDAYIDSQYDTIEYAQVCRAVYASTQNEQERNIYFNMLDKLNKR